MYGLPEDFDGAFFVRCTLELVCFSENNISLCFDRDVGLIIEGSFSYQKSPSKSNVPIASVPASESDLMRLLGHAVAEVSARRDGTLVLVFTNGHVFSAFDDSRQLSPTTSGIALSK